MSGRQENHDFTSKDGLPTDALSIRHLHKSFGGVRAVSGVDFSIRRNEVVGLIGPNGSGKTTLLNVLVGHYRADAGSVTLFGNEIAGLPAHQIARRGVIRTWQDPRIVPGLTARKNIMLGALARLGSDATGEVNALLERFRLTNQADLLAENLPYGQQKMVSIARSLAASPAVLLLDEPLAGLSQIEIAFVLEIINAFRETGTVLIVDHAFGVISRLCDRIVVLNSGRKLIEGSPQEVAASPAVREVYFGR